MKPQILKQFYKLITLSWPIIKLSSQKPKGLYIDKTTRQFIKYYPREYDKLFEDLYILMPNLHITGSRYSSIINVGLLDLISPSQCPYKLNTCGYTPKSLSKLFWIKQILGGVWNVI